MTATTTENDNMLGRNGERRLLWHLIAILFLIAAATVLFYKFYYQRGILMHVDMTFPTSIDRNLSLYTHTWWQYGSVENIWNTQRVFWSVPLLGAAKLLSLSTSQYLLILFLGTFALAGISMYVFAFKIIGWSELAASNTYAPFVGSVFAALIFMYNPWSVGHLWPYFGYPGYAVMPLVFLILVKAVDTLQMRYIVGLALLISVTGTGPIIVAWFWFLILTYLLFHLAIKRFSREAMKAILRVLAPLVPLYLLLNAMWMLPVTAALVAKKPFLPLYPSQLTQKGLDMLSSQNSILNNLRFASGWLQPVDPQVSGTFWVILSFALPVFAVLGLLILNRKIRRNHAVVFWSLVFISSVLLATGSSFILRKPYSYFSLSSPGAAQFGWVLRAADRWLSLAAVFYALVLGMLVTHLLGAASRLKKALAVAAIVIVLLSFGPITLSYARTVYNPTQIPHDYEEVNDYINKANEGARPIWVPFSVDGFRYYWAPEKRIRGFNIYSSNPNLNNLQDVYNSNSYYYWLESLFTERPFGPFDILNKDVMVKKNLGSGLFIPFSAPYMIFDSSVPGYRFGKTFDEDSSMELVLKTSILKLFKLKNSTPHIRAASRVVEVDSYYDELALVQKLSADELKRICFLVDEKHLNKKYGAIRLNDYVNYFDINSGFEETGGDGLPLGWTRQRGSSALTMTQPQRNPAKQQLPEGEIDLRTTLYTDSEVKRSGEQSIRIENSATESLAVSKVAGSEINARPGEIYRIETSIRHKNSKWTHAAVEGYENKTGKWITLARCPTATTGTSGWKETKCSFYLPVGFSRIRPVLLAGWAMDSGKGPGISWFDNIKLGRVDDAMYSEIRSGGPDPIVDYKQVSPEKYLITVKDASRPFLLVFGEAFDPPWVVKTQDGRIIDPVSVYNIITGFPLDRKGGFQLTIEYTAQRWFVLGLKVGLVTLVFCVACLGFGWFRRRRGSVSSLSLRLRG